MDNLDNMNTPETLANWLDEVVPPHQTNIYTDNLEDRAELNDLVMTAARLSAAPLPTLSPEAFAKIEAQMRTTPFKPIKQPLISLRTSVAAAAATIFLIALAALVLWLRQSPTSEDVIVNLSTATSAQFPQTTVTVTSVGITAPAIPDKTSTVTAEPDAPTPTPTPFPSTNTNTPQPSNTASLTPKLTAVALIVTTASDTPTPQPSATFTIVMTPILTDQAVEIIIEGAIEKIEDNTLTVYGFQIQLPPDDPLLKVLRVDDVVRVEGDVQGYEETLVIFALKLELQNEDVTLNEVYIQGETGEVWRDNGTCANRPPDWAKALLWRRRCEQPQNDGNSQQPQNPGQGGNNQGNNNSGGRGMGDDDDDD